MIDVPAVRLNNSADLPMLGLGTWKMAGPEAEAEIAGALNMGYRLIDTAKLYENEAEVGMAVKNSRVRREEIFITSKLWKDSLGYDDALRAFDATLTKLKLEYLDMYLIHWPGDDAAAYKSAWKAMEKLVDQKVVKTIGVSNFSPGQLSQLLMDATVVPAVNQIELNPLRPQTELRQYCQDKNIVIESYSPLGRAGQFLFDKINPLANKLGKTPAQVILRWHIQHGLVAIPKSSSPQRQKENLNIFDFELSTEDMSQIDNLAQA